MTQDDSSAAPDPKDQARTPAPERGSPKGDEADVADHVAEDVEQGDHPDANPLAPPTNTEAGS